MAESLSKPLNQSIKDSIQPNASLGSDLRRESAHTEVMTESMLTVDQEQAPKLIKRYKILTYSSICCTVVGLILFLIFPPLLHSQIVSGATQQSILTSDNQNLWAHFPGDSQTVITRNFSFFNLVNDEEVLLKGAIPQFREVQGYIIQQKEDYIDIEYLENDNKVKMRDWLHFDVHEDSRDMNEQIKIINLPSLGYWYNVKHSKESQVFIQGFSLLFTNIEGSIIQTVVGQGVYSQFLANETAYTNLLNPAGISPQNSVFMYEDKTYGVGEQDNIGYWVLAATNSFTGNNSGFSPEAINLKDYFTLSDEQLFILLAQFRNFIVSIEKLIIKNHYCEDIVNCTGRELAIRQIASSYVTKNVPPVGDVEPTDTICDANVTCSGYFPQLYAYYHNIYLKEHPEESPMLQFDVDIVRGWLDYNPDNIEKHYSKAENALFHIGNLDALFNNGTLYDQAKDQSQKNSYLENIRSRFKLQTAAHTRVFWNWIKYIMSQLLRQSTSGNQILGIASSFTDAFYQNFMILQDSLQPFITKQLIKYHLNGTNCLSLITISLQTDNIELVNAVCDHYNQSILSDQFIYDGIRVCRDKYQQEWKQWIELGVSEVQTESFCDPEVNNGFGQLYNAVRIQLNDFYKCDKTPNQYCSDYQLALKQWANSTVTTIIPQELSSILKTSLTFSSWFPAAKNIQYSSYAQKIGNKTIHNFTMDEIFSLFNFDNYFSATRVLGMFKSEDVTEDFKDYIRYIVIFIEFGGFTRARSAYDFIFGYNDQNLLKIKETYPPFGGDPSIPAYVAFNDVNQTEQEAVLELEWHTGKDNVSMLAQFSKINNLTYLTNNFSYFNGNETYWELDSPWKGQDYFYGTSGKQFPPDQQNTRNISIYVPNLQRYGSGNSEESEPYERYGYDLRIAYLGDYIFKPSSIYPDNDKYYQNFFGVFNETSVLGFPLMITKHHFMNVSSNWTDLIEMYNEDMSIKYVNTSHWDDSYIIVQPFSGLAFQAIIYLQSNYYYEPDQLFKYDKTTMMPVFSIYRSGNITQSKANQLFAPLKIAITLKTVFFYVGLFLTICFLILTFYAWSIKTKLQKGLHHKNKQLDISMQKQDDQVEKRDHKREEKKEENHGFQPLVLEKDEEEGEQEMKKESQVSESMLNDPNFQIGEQRQLHRESIPISDD